MDTKGKRLRLLWPDLHGIERGKYLYGDWQDRGRANFNLGTFALTFDREILPIPGLALDVGLPDFEARIDPTTLRPGWEPNTVVGVGDVSFRRERLAVDPRDVLRRAIAPWKERGLTVQLSFESEFYLLRPDGTGHWTRIDTPSSRVFGTGMAVDPGGIVGELIDTANECGFPMEAWCSEFDDAQFEINIHYDDAMQAADDAFLFRVLAHEIAARHGHRATFLGRPFNDRGGSGLHVNISFADEHGRNVLEDPSSPDGLSELAHQAIAGMLAHHAGTAAICAPTVNAYKRLLPGMMNGYWANWGHDDRTVAVRVSPERGPATRLENRVPDGATNPYLAAASLLHACRFGVEALLPLPAQQPLGQTPVAGTHVPATLAEALDAFAADTELCEALGPELVGAFTILKRAEWERYVANVPDPATTDTTDWELRYYMPFF